MKNKESYSPQEVADIAIIYGLLSYLRHQVLNERDLTKKRQYARAAQYQLVKYQESVPNRVRSHLEHNVEDLEAICRNVLTTKIDSPKVVKQKSSL